MQLSTTNLHHVFKISAALLLFTIILSTPFATHAAVGKAKKSVDSTCMQTAVAARETSIMEAFVTFNESVIEALTERKDALNDAWAMSEGSSRTADIKEAWAAWKTAKKSAHTELKSDRKAAWDTFKTTVKTSCKTTLPKEEGLEKDSSGSISL